MVWSMFCMTKINNNTMTTNNNKHIIINEILRIKQLHVTFLSKPSAVFNISSSHSNTNLPIRRFSQK